MWRGCSGSARSVGQETELGSFMAVCANGLSTDTTIRILWAKAAPVGDVLRRFPDFSAGRDDPVADAAGALVGQWLLAWLWRTRCLCHADGSITHRHPVASRKPRCRTRFWRPAIAGLVEVIRSTPSGTKCRAARNDGLVMLLAKLVGGLHKLDESARCADGRREPASRRAFVAMQAVQTTHPGRRAEEPNALSRCPCLAVCASCLSRC